MRSWIVLSASVSIACGSQAGGGAVGASDGGGADGADALLAGDSPGVSTDAPEGDSGGATASVDGAATGDAASSSDGAAAGDGGAGQTWVIGYYSGFGAAYPVTEIDWSGLTHLAVAFYLTDAAGNIDESLSQGNAGQALGHSLVTAAHAAGKKILASFGGSDSQASWQGATSAANLATFVANVKGIVTAYGYDGVDLDWEPFDPGNPAAMQALVGALRAALPATLVTMPVGCENDILPTTSPSSARSPRRSIA